MMEDDDDDYSERDLTEEELNQIVIYSNKINIKGNSGIITTHYSPNNFNFNVLELIKAIEKTEFETRNELIWFDGIDAHHIFFEGITLNDDNVWETHWGS